MSNKVTVQSRWPGLGSHLGLDGEESTFKLTSLVEFSSLQAAGLRAVEGQVENQENQESVMSQEPRGVGGAGWRHQRLAWIRA